MNPVPFKVRACEQMVPQLEPAAVAELFHLGLVSRHLPIVLPYAGYQPILKCAWSRVTRDDIWIVEPDAGKYLDILRHPSIDVLSAQTFHAELVDWLDDLGLEEWAGTVILNAPPETAALDTVMAWVLLRCFGTMVSVVPKRDLTGGHEDAQLLQGLAGRAEAWVTPIPKENYSRVHHGLDLQVLVATRRYGVDGDPDTGEVELIGVTGSSSTPNPGEGGGSLSEKGNDP